jgi:hypothetical protein
MDTDLRNIEKPGDRVVFSLSSPKGGEGWGEEAVFNQPPLTPALSPLVPHGARENFSPSFRV